MKQILIGYDVLLQCLLEEGEALEDVNTLWEILRTPRVQGYITQETVDKLYEFIAKNRNTETANLILYKFQKVLKIWIGFNRGIDTIVTHNEGEARVYPFPILSVQQFLQRYDLENLLDLEISRNEANKFSEFLVKSKLAKHVPGEILLWSFAAIILLKLIQYHIDTNQDNRDKPTQDKQEIPTAEDTKFTLFDSLDFITDLHENYSLDFPEGRDSILGITEKDYLVGAPDGGVDWLLGEMRNNLPINNTQEVNFSLGKASGDSSIEPTNKTIENIANINSIIRIYEWDGFPRQGHRILSDLENSTLSDINMVGAKHSGDNLSILPEY